MFVCSGGKTHPKNLLPSDTVSEFGRFLFQFLHALPKIKNKAISTLRCQHQGWNRGVSSSSILHSLRNWGGATIASNRSVPIRVLCYQFKSDFFLRFYPFTGHTLHVRSGEKGRKKTFNGSIKFCSILVLGYVLSIDLLFCNPIIIYFPIKLAGCPYSLWRTSRKCGEALQGWSLTLPLTTQGVGACTHKRDVAVLSHMYGTC